MSEVTGTASTASVAAASELTAVASLADPSSFLADGPGAADVEGKGARDDGAGTKGGRKTQRRSTTKKGGGSVSSKSSGGSKKTSSFADVVKSAQSAFGAGESGFGAGRPSSATNRGAPGGGFGHTAGGGRKVDALDGAPPPLPGRNKVKGLSWNKEGGMKRTYARPWEKNGPQIIYHSPLETNAAIRMQRWWKWKRQDLSGYQIRKLSRKHQNQMMRKIDKFEHKNIASIHASRQAMVGGLQHVEDTVHEEMAEWETEKQSWHLSEAERHEQERQALEAEELERQRREREREREAHKAIAAAEQDRLKREEAEAKRKNEEAAKNAAEEERLRIRMEQMKAEMAATEDMVTKWLEKNCVDGFHLEMHLNFAYPADYKVGPVLDGVDGDDATAKKMRKMKQDWVLGMVCQTFLPCSVRNVATLMKTEGWTSTMDSHWFEIIRALFNDEVINMTANEDGMPNEVWF